MASKTTMGASKKTTSRPAIKATKAPASKKETGSQKTTALKNSAPQPAKPQPAKPKLAKPQPAKPKSVKPGGARQKPSGGLALLKPARSGVASTAAARADRSVSSKQQERQKAASNLLGEALQPEALEASVRLPVPSLQGLFAISSEQGIFVGVAAPPNTQPLVRVGLAQRLPREWILPFDESRAALGLQTMQLSNDIQAMVYLAFVPLVALGAADLLKGEQLFGGQTLTGSLVTFPVACEYYRQAKPQAVAAKLMKLEDLFAQVFEKTLAADHPLRKGFENLREQKVKAEQSKSQASTWQGHHDQDMASASLSAMRAFLSQMPSDMQALKDRFLAEPQNEESAQAFGKKLLAATRQDALGGQRENGESTHAELESFLTELALLEFALVEKEQVHKTPKPVKTRQRKTTARASTEAKSRPSTNARAAVALRALP